MKALLANLFLLSIAATVTTALAAYTSSQPAPTKSYLVTGANKGQGYALCQRILTEQPNTHVFLCSRDLQRGLDAKTLLLKDCGIDSDGDLSSRVDVVQLDVTNQDSVNAALETVQTILSDNDADDDKTKTKKELTGIISNAGILWGYSLPELIDVCATGVKRVLDAFTPLVVDNGHVIVITSGLSPLMHSYSSNDRQVSLMDASSSWEESIEPMIHECLSAYEQSTTIEERIAAFESIHFPGGPFSQSVPDFHMYGLAKMFGDAYMLRIAKKYPRLRVNSVDPGLVYTDLILKMPKYQGLAKEETSAQSPKEGVEGTMQLLFGNNDNEDDDNGVGGKGSGKLYALNKERQLVFSDIDKMPQKQ